MRYFVGGNDAFRKLILGNRNTFSASTAAEWRYPGPHTMLRFAANTMDGRIRGGCGKSTWRKTWNKRIA